MTIIDFNKAKLLKTLKDHGEIASEKQVQFYDVPVNKVGVDAIMSTNGRQLTENEIKEIVKVAEKLKIKE